MKSLSIKTIIAVALGVLCFFVINISATEARTIDVGKLQINYDGDGALFNAINIYPGFSEEKIVTIKNTGQVNHSFSIAISNQLGSLANVLQIEPRYFENNAPIWNKTISNISKSPNSDIIINSISPGETRTIKIVAILPETVGNEYQNASTFAFDFVVGNESNDQNEPSLSSNFGTDIISSAGDIITSKISNYINDNNNANDDKNAESTKQLNSAVEKNSKEVEGVETQKPICFWWWVLLIVLAVILFYYERFIEVTNKIILIMVPMLFGVVIYLVHLMLHRYFIPSKWCEWWLISILIIEIIVYYVYYNYKAKNKNNK